MAHPTVSLGKMNFSRKSFGHYIAIAALLLAQLFFAGCDLTAGSGKPIGGTDGIGTTTQINSVLRVGNKVKIEFSGLPPGDQLLPREEQTKEINADGNITGLPLLTNSVPAAGITTRELEQAIHELYVPKYYKHITVSVTSTDRYYSVGGQVNHPGPQLYTGDITVLKAIHSAGDFTDFGKRTNVQLFRAGAKKPIVVDCQKILDGHLELDLPIYPGDTIVVRRKII